MTYQKKKQRLSGDERKKKIIESAMPLFAENGFVGTSVRAIASAADISESLLYKYFPSKINIYQEIQKTLFGEMKLLVISDKYPPGARSLVYYIYYIAHVLFLKGIKNELQIYHEKILLHSMVKDAKYAKKHFSAVRESVGLWIIECIEEAIKDGDVDATTISPELAFWYIHHLFMSLNYSHLQGDAVFEYEGAETDLADSAIMFVLRGIGMKEPAIADYYNKRALKKEFQA